MSPYKMLRRTKSSSLLPIGRLANYFYPETPAVDVKEMGLAATAPGMEVYPRVASASSSSSGSLTPPLDYEQLYNAIQLDTSDGNEDERVRKKYACQGKTPTDNWEYLDNG